MNLNHLLTAESVEEFRRLTQEAQAAGPGLFAEYSRDREQEVASSPILRRWIRALEDGGLDEAAGADLWAEMIGRGFVELPAGPPTHADTANFEFRVISPKVLDAYRDTAAPRLQYALTEVRVCARREPLASPRVVVPAGWRDAVVVDTELFEIPPNVSPDNVDDREKIHLIYLAAMEGDRFVYRPLYIGVGTGEAYGVGPSRRTTQGRSRFYRYDVKDNFHLEYVTQTELREWEERDVRRLPDVTRIGDDQARLLLGKGAADSGFMSLSDPTLAEAYTDEMEWPVSRAIFREILLEKKRDDLQTDRPSTSFAADDPGAVLRHAWRVYGNYYVAWLHPERLSAREGLDHYYRELPRFRRDEYAIYRFRAELFGIAAGDAAAEELTIPNVLWNPERRRRLEEDHPAALRQIEAWARRQIILDLYHYGNHAEVRLRTAIALWERLKRGGAWDELLRATYRGRLFEVTLSRDRVCAASATRTEQAG